MRARSLLSTLLPLIAILGTSACGGGDSPSGTSGGTRGLAMNVTISSSSFSDALQEVALLVDGTQVGQSVVSASGTGSAHFDSQAAVTGAGSHTVAVRVVKQKYASATYTVIGAVVASNSSTGQIAQQTFPLDPVTLTAGGQVQVSVVVP